jgi:putative transposase
LNEQEQAAFRQAEERTSDSREVKRLEAVRLYGSGYAVEIIQEATGCSGRSLLEWCQAYRNDGLEGLKSHWQGNNALKLSRVQRADLSERLRRYRPDQVISPDVRISQGQFWTVSDLKIVVQDWYEVSYQSAGSYRSLLHESRFSQQQVQNQYRSRPDECVIADFEARLEKK